MKKNDYTPMNASGINPTRLKFKRDLEQVLLTAPKMCGTCVECYMFKCMRYDAEIDKEGKYSIQDEDCCPDWRTYDADLLFPEDNDEISF